VITDESANALCVLYIRSPKSEPRIVLKHWQAVKKYRVRELIAWATLMPFIFRSGFGVFYWREPVIAIQNRVSIDTRLIRPAMVSRPPNGHALSYELHQPAWERMRVWMNSLKS